jgi:hypothetical protein
MKWCADCRTRFLGWLSPQKKTFCAWHCSRRRVGTAWVNTHTGNTSGVTGRQHRDRHWLGKWCGWRSLIRLTVDCRVVRTRRDDFLSSSDAGTLLIAKTLLPLLPKRHHTNRRPPQPRRCSRSLSEYGSTDLALQPHRGCSTHNSNITWIASQS